MQEAEMQSCYNKIRELNRKISINKNRQQIAVNYSRDYWFGYVLVCSCSVYLQLWY